MELLIYPFAIAGFVALLWLLVYVLGGLTLSFQSWQLKRTRVHDDLNRHERELNTQAVFLGQVQGELKDVWNELRGFEKRLAELKESSDSLVNPSGGDEEIPEAITITEVPSSVEGFRYFLDFEGDIWRFKDGALGNELFYRNDGWTRGDANLDSLLESVHLSPITERQAEGLTQ